MQSCKDVAEKASALIDGDLTPWESLRVRVHLMMCRGCRNFVAQLRATDRLVSGIASGDTLPRADSDGAARVLSAFRDGKRADR